MGHPVPFAVHKIKYVQTAQVSRNERVKKY